MDITVLNPYFYPYNGGTENVLLEIYKRLSKKHNITIISGTPPNDKKTTYEEMFGIKIIRLQSQYIHIPKAPLPFLNMKGIRDTIKKEKSDIYHINNRYQYGFGVIRDIKKNGSMALTIHNSLPKNIDLITDTFGLLYDLIKGRKIIASADIITGVSKDAINVTVPKHTIKKAYVVYNGVNYNLFKHRSKKNPNVKRIIDKLNLDDFTIFNNGRLVPQKGQIYLLKAVKLLIESGYKVNAMIVGYGPRYTYLQKLSKTLGIEKNIILVGKIPQNEIKYYYNAADIFCLPSTYEPASVALLESLASELPTVASRIGGIPEMMGKYGFYIKPKDEYSIYNKIKFVLDNNPNSKSLIKEGRKRMINDHNWDKISKRYEELFYNTIRY